MKLLLTERIRTHMAFLNGEEWTEQKPVWITLDQLSDFILSKQIDGRTAVTTLREERTEIVVEFSNSAAITTSQLRICYDGGDHDEIMSELRQFCKFVPE